MSDLMINTGSLPELSVSQLAALPQQQLQEFDLSLNLMATWIRQSRDRLNTALDQRYGEQARQSLQESGRDFGVTHIDDGALQVTYELPKRVSWDQQRLAEMAERIAAAGENVADFIDVEYSVSESRFKNWPATLRDQFEPARTVKPGKASFRLALVEGGAA